MTVPTTTPAPQATTFGALVDACAAGPREAALAQARLLGPELAGQVVASLLDRELTHPTATPTPIVAAHLAHELRLTRAVPALVRGLVALPDVHPLLHAVRVALARLGADAVDALLTAFDAASPPDARARIAEVLLRMQVADDRIRAALVRLLEEAPSTAARYLAEYGDPRALPELARALDPAALEKTADCAICASEIAVSIARAIRALGGTLTDAQRATIDRLLERQRGMWQPFPPDPRPPRNAPCPCGSGKKYKKCCYLTDGLGAEH
jgi:hypothetical protein